MSDQLTRRDLRYRAEAAREREHVEQERKRAEHYRDLSLGLAAFVAVKHGVDLSEFFGEDDLPDLLSRTYSLSQRDRQDAVRP